MFVRSVPVSTNTVHTRIRYIVVVLTPPTIHQGASACYAQYAYACIIHSWTMVVCALTRMVWDVQGTLWQARAHAHALSRTLVRQSSSDQQPATLALSHTRLVVPTRQSTRQYYSSLLYVTVNLTGYEPKPHGTRGRCERESGTHERASARAEDRWLRGVASGDGERV